MTNRWMRRGATALMATAFAGGGLFLAQPAGASAYENFDNVTVSPAASEYSKGDQVTIQLDGLEPGTDYRVGQCTYAVYSFEMVPGCSADSQKDVVADANGEIEVTVPLTDIDDNAHGPADADLPGQPEEVDFRDAGSAEIMVAEHIEGVGGIPVGDSEEFSVN